MWGNDRLRMPSRGAESAGGMSPAPAEREVTEMRVLIAYATKSGSTREIAEAVARAFQSKGFGADVRELRDIQDIAGYDAVVLGGPIYLDKIMPEVMHFATKWRTALATVPLGHHGGPSYGGGTERVRSCADGMTRSFNY